MQLYCTKDGKENVIEDEYIGDEIDNDKNDDSRKDKHNVIRFNEDDVIAMNFNFKIGIKISSS